MALCGKDSPYWAGHYGAKFASAQLAFIRCDELPAFGAAQSQELWAGRKAAGRGELVLWEPPAQPPPELHAMLLAAAVQEVAEQMAGWDDDGDGDDYY